MTSPETRTCQNCRVAFVVDATDFAFYEKMRVPPPTWCPECRLQRRLAWRNERGLYKRSCDKCGKSIISVFSKDTGMTVYCRPCWWADEWDGLQYGMDFDPQKPFFLQLIELFRKTPAMALFGVYHTLQNSDYVNMASYLKNCYMLFHSDESENCLYGSMISRSKDCIDNLILGGCERCYENVNCQKCYSVRYSIDCEDCVDAWFCKNCLGCNDCFGCVNLRNQKYHIYNKPYSKEEYQRRLNALGLSSRRNLGAVREQARAFWRHFPQKYIHARHAVEVSGDYLYNCKNTHDSFVANDMENSRFCSLVTPGKTTNAYDFTHYGIAADWMYESLQCGNQSSNIRFSWFVLAGSHSVDYSMFCIGCSDCFGTVGLKKRQYCILNKQYSRQEYEKLRGEIIEQMQRMTYQDARGNRYAFGEFFPAELSPFGYNATTAQESFPLSKEVILSHGLRYKPAERYDYKETLTYEELPDVIDDVADTITKEIITCAHHGECGDQCTRVFRIVPEELAWYRSLNIPLPSLCPSCRFDERLKDRNPFRLWRRHCMCQGTTNQQYKNVTPHRHGNGHCPEEFMTSFAPEREEIVYCEACYNQEVA